ncbi:hypothetical protein D9758_000995 [Tetrapyrgos nigripes]|uniref:F-box domain-containing protein n=1 Tax=Tetrapyrgos nigripes TaxID=182062 RepID=A0A8H5GZG8_9AGAR|nr:hypothetical protein D9758_000995 [Tetrapyrgos nigripes]
MATSTLVTVTDGVSHSTSIGLTGAENTLAGLEEHHNTLGTSVNDDNRDNDMERIRGPCYVNQIPTELLLEVFALSLSSENAPTSTPSDSSTTTPSSMLWKLPQVCSTWRSIVSECMASTWASIDLQNPRPNVVPALAVCLQRAKDSPLSITLNCSRKTTSDDFKSCLDLLLRECHRWQSLSITLPIDLLDHFEDAILQSGLGLPLLESLAFSLVKPGLFAKQTPAQPIRVFEFAPQLHKVTSQLSLDHLILPLSQLTSLRTLAEIHDVSSFLQEQAPGLKHLAACKISPAGSGLGVPSIPSPTSISLASLELSLGSKGCFHKLLFPFLEKLTIQSAEKPDFDGLSSSPCTYTPFPTLTHLAVGLVLSMRPDTLFELLRATPAVESLVINVSLYKKENFPLVEGLFSGLSGTSPEPQKEEQNDSLIPNLSSLTFAQLIFPDSSTGSDSGSRWRSRSRVEPGSDSNLELQKCMLDAFVKMVRSRVRSAYAQAGVTKLQKLTIEKYHPPSMKEVLKNELMEFVELGLEVVVGEEKLETALALQRARA